MSLPIDHVTPSSAKIEEPALSQLNYARSQVLLQESIAAHARRNIGDAQRAHEEAVKQHSEALQTFQEKCREVGALLNVDFLEGSTGWNFKTGEIVPLTAPEGAR